jgi:hypothetical protein
MNTLFRSWIFWLVVGMFVLYIFFFTLENYMGSFERTKEKFSYHPHREEFNR